MNVKIISNEIYVKAETLMKLIIKHLKKKKKFH